MKFIENNPVQQLYIPNNVPRFRPRTRGNYDHHLNHVYAEAFGFCLTMDIFIPRQLSNNLGIVDVVSGAWHADRIRLNEHIGLGLIDSLCERGYTVFAVSPGSVEKFTGSEMVSHIHAAIRHVRVHADQFGILPRPLGLVGASAGGHLAAMSASAGNPANRNPYKRCATAVEALGLFFPPTDLLNYGGKPFNFKRSVGLPVETLLFHDTVDNHTSDEVYAQSESLSPARIKVPENMPPLYLMHATEDEVVPFQQSELYAAHLKNAGIPVTFTPHHGKGHPWPKIHNDIEKLTDWFDVQLLGG